jgi:hypothetical protein
MKISHQPTCGFPKNPTLLLWPIFRRIVATPHTEQYFDSCGVFRDAVISIAATLAKQERLKISERTLAGLERARKQGRRPAVGARS